MSFYEGADKGHAWVIAFTAGMITLILSGISKMVGILYVAVIDHYEVTREEATLPFTFRKALRNLTGPIVGIIGHRYGIRTVTIAGAIVAALGAGLSFITPTITWLTVCWGGIHGFGEAFANTLYPVVVNQHFEKYRSTASGISLSGACVGSFFFSFLVEFLFETYGLQGTFLILSGIILNVVPAAILLKSPPNFINNMKTKSHENSPLKEHLKNNPPKYVVPEEYTKTEVQKRKNNTLTKTSHLENNELKITAKEQKSLSNACLVKNSQVKLDSVQGFENLAFEPEKDSPLNKIVLEKKINIENTVAIFKENIFEKLFHLYRLSSSKEEPPPKMQKCENNAKSPKSMGESVKAITKLYSNPVFVMICVCMVLYVLVLFPIVTTMVDYSKDKGFPEYVGKYMIHAVALGDIFGRACLGWVTDKKYISIQCYMLVGLFLQGTFVLLLPFADSLWNYLLLLGLYSMVAGSMLVRFPVIVLKNVRQEEESVAIGCYAFIAGFIPFVVPFLIGHFRDQFGSYDGMYYLLGGVSYLSAGLWIIEPQLIRLNKALMEKTEKKKYDTLY